MAGRGRQIKVGSGVEGLEAPGYKRQEQLKSRLDNLQRVAEVLTTDNQVYSVDREKLKEEPEILKHFDFVNSAFTVSNPIRGKVYYWERDDHRMIAFRKGQARFFLGAGHKGWEVVTDSVKDRPEARELIMPDGTRKIGDVVLMCIDLDEYVAIQKKQLLMTKFRERNIPETLGQFVQQHEGLVQVHQMVNEDPRTYFGKHGTGGGPTRLVHTGTQEGNFGEVPTIEE